MLQQRFPHGDFCLTKYPLGGMVGEIKLKLNSNRMSTERTPFDTLQNLNLYKESLLEIGIIIGLKKALSNQEEIMKNYISKQSMAIGAEIAKILVGKIPGEQASIFGNRLIIACSRAITFTDEGIELRNWATLIIPEQEILKSGFPSSTNFVSQINSFWNNLAEISIIDFANKEGIKFSFKLIHQVK